MCYVPCPAVQQVAFADKILLNKTDLVSAADKSNVLKRIRVSSWFGTLLSRPGDWPLSLHTAASRASSWYVDSAAAVNVRSLALLCLTSPPDCSCEEQDNTLCQVVRLGLAVRWALLAESVGPLPGHLTVPV